MLYIYIHNYPLYRYPLRTDGFLHTQHSPHNKTPVHHGKPPRDYIYANDLIPNT